MVRGRLFAVVAIFLMVGVGAFGFQSAYWESAVASEDHVEFNDSITVNNGTTHTLNNSNLEVAYAPESDVNVTQTGTSFESTGNWSWNREDGTLFIFNNTSMTNNTEAFVDAYYAVPSGEQNVSKEVALLASRDLGGELELAGMIVLLLGGLALVMGAVRR